MKPSTSKPQDAFKAHRPGWWTCKLCDLHERGGQAAFYAHFYRVHFDPLKTKP